MTEMHTYNVAGHKFSICVNGALESWERLRSHYEIFADNATSEDITFSLVFEKKNSDSPVMSDDIVEIYSENALDPGFPGFSVYRESNDDLLFVIKHFERATPGGWIHVGKNFDRFNIITTEDKVEYLADSTFTMAAMLSFMLATTHADTLTMHSSCVVKDGRAYLFLGKSGTGKSTHARLWLKNIEGTTLMNDDHPIIRINNDGVPVAYGSPWSGKTNCYKKVQAPIGGIVKIEQAPHNCIRRLSPIEAYSKLMVSASGFTWFDKLADSRHKTIEKVIGNVPFYELECLPDDDAARVCFEKVAL